MTIKASASVTLSAYRDTEAITRYYKLVSSTASAPSKPTANPPSGWDDTEPSYTSGSTNTLYFCDLTEFSDGTWAYSAVSKSSSYEAAKEAYNKAQNAQDTAKMAIKNVDVEYYLSTSSTSLSGGSWQTTAPTWVDGKYMWSRTKITDGAGNVTYSPSQNGTCIAGAKGSTGATGSAGKGVSSITEEYYLSTSKTSQTGGEWSTTPPTWSSGKYIWTRSKIVYTNPSSTVYTAPVCDSSWEAVNEIEVGGRNLLLNTGNLTKWTKESGISVTPDSDGWYKITADSSLTSSRWGIYQDFSGYEQNTDYTVSLYLKNGSGAGNLSIGYGGWGSIVITGSSTETKYSYTFNTGSNTDVLRIYICLWITATGKNFYVKLPKLEKGNKATDWTPAPEDMVDKANIVSCINQTPESITIQANKISLEGLITANSNFKILSDGSMETIAGKIGGWSIGDTLLSSSIEYNTSNYIEDLGYTEYEQGTIETSLNSNVNSDNPLEVVRDFTYWEDPDERSIGTRYRQYKTYIRDDGTIVLNYADKASKNDITGFDNYTLINYRGLQISTDDASYACYITAQDIQFLSVPNYPISVYTSIVGSSNPGGISGVGYLNNNIRALTWVCNPGGNKYVYAPRISGYYLYAATNGDYNAFSGEVTSVARQGVTDIVFFNAYHNGAMRLNLFYVKTNF